QEAYDSINEFSQQIEAPLTTCAPLARTLEPDVSMRDFYKEFQRFQELIQICENSFVGFLDSIQMTY
ncbi:unnamed protein product, partial [Allacma fusca]